MDLKGKVVVITGGEGPLGRVVSKKFLAEGAKAVIAWYSQDEWKEAKGMLSDYTEQFVDMNVDATKEEQVVELMKKARNTFGSIDFLLHMVGMHQPNGELLWETDTALLERLWSANTKSAFLCSKHAIKVMLEKGQGRIVVFPARLAIEPKPRRIAYSLSKIGLITLVEALREELKDTNITVNAVMPDAIDSFRTINSPTPREQKVKPEDIAKLLVTLCQDDTNILSGSILKIFGKR
jgi:3-oxoacyl-[acyl-carrier protein] reductase